jgi:hypothetical protein
MKNNSNPVIHPAWTKQYQELGTIPQYGFLKQEGYHHQQMPIFKNIL